MSTIDFSQKTHGSNVWFRRGRGHERQFFATNIEIQEWLATSLPVEYAPYELVGVDLRREHNTYVRDPFKCSINNFIDCRCYESKERYDFWIRSMILTPSLDFGSTSFETICSYSGMVKLQHGHKNRHGIISSRISIVGQVENSITGERLVHDGYLNVFKASKHAIDRIVAYDSIISFPNGNELASKFTRWTEGAAREYHAGVPFEERPGERIVKKRR